MPLVCCGYNHIASVDEDGNIWICGELGSLTRTWAQPKRISSHLHITSVSCGKNSTIALDDQGFGWGIGSNLFGGLGLDPPWHKKAEVSEFHKITLPDYIINVACGNFHSMFITHNEALYGTGRNYNGQLGLSDLRNRSIPELIPNICECISVSAGAEHTVILTRDGKAWSCGLNNEHQLGYTTSRRDHSLIFRVIHLEDIIEIACGTLHSLFLNSSGKVFVYGKNDGNHYNSSSYHEQNIEHIDAGGHNSILIRGGQTLCFGPIISESEKEWIRAKNITAIAMNRSCMLRDDDGIVWVFGRNFNSVPSRLENFSHIIAPPPEFRAKSARK